MGSPDLTKLREAIDALNLEHDDKLMKLIQPVVYEEFDNVRKVNPKLKSIVFGNGTYFIELEGAPTWENWGPEKCPAYAKKLCELCELAAELVALEDIVAEG